MNKYIILYKSPEEILYHSTVKPFDIIKELPTEIALQIFSHLSTKDLQKNCTRVNRGWNILSCDPSFWGSDNFGQFFYKMLLISSQKPETLSKGRQAMLLNSKHFSLGDGSTTIEKTLRIALQVGLIIKKFDCRISPEFINRDALVILPKELKSLTLFKCELLKDEDFKYLPESLKNLSIRNCPITDDALKFMPGSLESLYLNNCRKITKEGIEQIPESINHVVVKYIHGFGNVEFKYDKYNDKVEINKF